MAPPAALEVEAKLTVPSERDLQAIAQLVRIGPYALRRRGRSPLHSVYFDTADLVLARYGMALRARRSGRRWEITLKWTGEVSGFIHARPELTEPFTGPPNAEDLQLPADFHRQVCAVLAGRKVQPVLVSDLRRDVVDVLGANGAGEPLAEMALDKVQLHAPLDSGTSTSYCEVEIEQKHGTREDVDQIARLLQQRFELAPSTGTKFSHGLNLLYGPELAEHQPPLADGTLGRAAQRLVGRHLDRLRLNDPGTRLGLDPEALHDMRVASRRLRALLRFFHGAFPAVRCKHLRAELRWLNQLLSPVRDCDVQLETLLRHESVLAGARRTALQPYREHILRQRDVHRREMLASLESKRYFALVLQLEQFAFDRRPLRLVSARAPAAEVGRDAVKRAFRHVVREGRKAALTPNPEQLHAARIRVKRLRYLLEFFRGSCGKPGRRLLSDLVKVQDLLGIHNDATVAASFLDTYVNGPGADSKPATLLTLGGFLQEELRRARKARARFHRTWKRFADKQTARDARAVQLMLKREAAVVAARGSNDQEIR